MKTLLTFILALLFVGTTHGQSLYLSTDAGNNGYMENTQVGVNYDLGNEYKVRFITGYSKSHTVGDYMNIGIGAEKTFQVAGINPVISFESKAYFGDNKLSHADEFIHNMDRTSQGISTNGFIGLSYHSVDFGVSVDYVASQLYFNPLSVRLSL